MEIADHIVYRINNLLDSLTRNENLEESLRKYIKNSYKFLERDINGKYVYIIMEIYTTEGEVDSYTSRKAYSDLSKAKDDLEKTVEEFLKENHEYKLDDSDPINKFCDSLCRTCKNTQRERDETSFYIDILPLEC